MLETYLKPVYTKVFVAPLTNKLLLPKKITPNQVTTFGAAVGLLAGLMVALHLPVLGIIFILLSGYADTIDGYLATVSNQQTDLGCILDIVSDRVVEISIIFGLYFYASDLRGAYALLMLASVTLCITCFLVVSMFQSVDSRTENKGFFYSVGLMERAEAFIFFIAMIIFPAQFNLLAILFSVAVLATAFLHVFRFHLRVRKL